MALTQRINGVRVRAVLDQPIAELLAEQGRVAEVEQVLQAALSDDVYRLQALATIVAANAYAGDIDKARELFDAALAEDRFFEAFADVAYRGIAAAEATAGDISAALTTAGSIESPEIRAAAVAEIAVIHADAEAGTEDWSSTLTAALREIRDVPVAVKRIYLFILLAGDLAAVGRIGAAQETLWEAAGDPGWEEVEGQMVAPLMIALVDAQAGAAIAAAGN